MRYARFIKIPCIFRIKDNVGPTSWLIFPAGFELAYFSSEDVRTVSCYSAEQRNKSERVSRECCETNENVTS